MPESIQDFYARVKEETEKVKNEDNFITSIENPEFDRNHKAGRVIAVPRKLAGLYIAKRTHRLATPEEVEAWKLDQTKRREEILSEEQTKAPGLILPHVLAGMNKR